MPVLVLDKDASVLEPIVSVSSFFAAESSSDSFASNKFTMASLLLVRVDVETVVALLESCSSFLLLLLFLLLV